MQCLQQQTHRNQQSTLPTGQPSVSIIRSNLLLKGFLAQISRNTMQCTHMHAYVYLGSN